MKLIKTLIDRIILTPEQYARKQGVKIGNNCWIATRNFGSEPYLITIGNHVQITDKVAFFTHGGGWVFRNEIPDMDTFGKIEIHDNVYIGYGSLVLPGVTIHSNVIVGAGSVVTKSVPEGVIIAGNPARIIAKLSEYKNRMILYNLKTKGLNSKDKRLIIENAKETRFMKKSFLRFPENIDKKGFGK